MTKQLKYELIHKIRIMFPTYLISFIIYAVLFIVAGVTGMNGWKIAAIALTSVVFSGVSVVFIVSMCLSFNRDFKANTKYLAFSVPQNGRNYLISRFIALTVEILAYLALGLLVFLMLIFHYTSISSNVWNYLTDAFSDIDTWVFIFKYLIIGILLYTQLFLAAYLSQTVAMSRLNGGFLRALTCLAVLVIYYYLVGAVDFLPLWLAGGTVERFRFIFSVSISSQSVFQMGTYYLLKAAEIAATYILTVKLLNKPINLN